uniref:Cell division control protein 45 homolog (Trinotate prediction) n=1 Tax=Henneguya salminicola TaxID=69463 RepID=A0A6G3MDV7_HENSL
MIVRNIKEDFYNIISNSNLFILASINIDSLCAVKIITSLLSSENIKYALTAVENREDLTACINENKNIYKKFLLVNCGGNFDLSSCLTEIEDIIIFVIDSHLPYNVENIYSATNVRLIINNNECLENIPEFNILFQTEESDEDRTFFNNERDNARQKYERFFSYGTPCAITMFDMSSKLGKDVIEYVWYAICGLTELFILRKMNNEKYISNILYLQQQVLRLSTSNNDPSACFNIISDNVLQIYLYTHWTLMDSLLKSPATSSHFQVWSFNGRKRLHGFLADMGCVYKSKYLVSL